MLDPIQQKVDKQQRAYNIAGLSLEVIFPDGFKLEKILPSFEPFLVEHIAGQKSICSIDLTFSPSHIQEDDAEEASGKLLSDISLIWGKRFRFYERDDCYITTIQTEDGAIAWKMKSSKDFSQSIIYTSYGEQLTGSALSWLIMVAFGQTCLLHNTILIHASVIACSGKGYAFLGKSGTGKSTHSRLWLEHIEETELLNDDNPAIRIESDGHVYVYGTPWSGKTSCYKNIRVPIEALIRLKQAPYNQLVWKKGLAAFIDVLPSCTAIRWNKQLFAEMNDAVEAIVQKIPVAELECLPNKEASLLCYHEILKITDKQTNTY